MKKIYSILRALVHFILLSKRSKYSFKDKIEVLRILVSNFIGIKLSANRSEVTQKIFHFKVSAFGYSDLQYLFVEIFLNNDYFFDTNNSSPKIIDCGANIGMAIFYFKKIWPDCSIIAFEANPYAFQLLEKNVRQNSLTNVQLFNIGLSNDEGVVAFFINENKGTLKGSFIEERGGANRIDVKTQKLSHFIDEDEFDMIKMDIEGAEVQVIQDLVTNVKMAQTTSYIIEYHHGIDCVKDNLSQFIRHFEDNGFKCNIRTGFNKTGDFQDILFHFYKN